MRSTGVGPCAFHTRGCADVGKNMGTNVTDEQIARTAQYLRTTEQSRFERARMKVSGAKATDGQFAYEKAVQGGFRGSRADWELFALDHETYIERKAAIDNMKALVADREKAAAQRKALIKYAEDRWGDPNKPLETVTDHASGLWAGTDTGEWLYAHHSLAWVGRTPTLVKTRPSLNTCDLPQAAILFGWLLFALTVIVGTVVLATT